MTTHASRLSASLIAVLGAMAVLLSAFAGVAAADPATTSMTNIAALISSASTSTRR
mgnify:CR=1 FL=1